ncbi:MAG: type III pantothenate kinase [Gallionella sp.]|nr:type III pantothenate kinase [Gallionella sp.]
MKLLIDAGNTRIKWALADANDWVRSGVLPVEQAGELAQQFVGIQQIWVSNVAGEEVARQIRNIRDGQPHFVVAREQQCGVRNGYSNAGQLGCDRWVALIAAWHLLHEKCLVVNCGTATTIDTLSGQGEFRGGLILPGVELMQRSLVAATDQLKSTQGKYVPLPRNTADALYSGAIQASCGAIERQHALLGDDSAPVVLSGGAAGALREHLGMPLHVVDNLVLQGLMLIAQETNA